MQAEDHKAKQRGMLEITRDIQKKVERTVLVIFIKQTRRRKPRKR